MLTDFVARDMLATDPDANSCERNAAMGSDYLNLAYDAAEVKTTLPLPRI